MIVNKYQGNGGGGGYVLPVATDTRLGGIKVGDGLSIDNSGVLSASGGSVDPEAVQQLIDETVNPLEDELDNGDFIVGMARQLYSPDGVDSTGCYVYRTTAGDEDVETGEAKIVKLEGNASYPEVMFDNSGELIRGGEAVEGVEIDFFSGVESAWTNVEINEVFSGHNATNVKVSKIETIGYYQFGIKKGDTLSSCTVKTNNTANTETVADTNATKIDNSHYTFSYDGCVGTIVFDGSDWTATMTTSNGYEFYMFSFFAWGASITATVEYYAERVVPDDIPIGSSSYVYDDAESAWSPSLPQAVASITIEGDPYVPVDGDELALYKEPYAEEPASYARPSQFVALGLNSFDANIENILTSESDETRVEYDSNEPDGHYMIWTGVSENTYFVRAVPGLADGYIVHSPNGHLPYRAGVANVNMIDPETECEFGTTVQLSASTTYVVYPTDEMPYIAFSIDPDYVEDICVHPRWSGKMDDAFEEFEEFTVDFTGLFEENQFMSIGDVRDYVDFDEQLVVWKIGKEAYSMEFIQYLVDEGKVLGDDFYIDNENVYYILDEPESEVLSDMGYDINSHYDANDFSVEYFDEYDFDEDERILMRTPIYAETFYITNLVDKLRRMKMAFVHLDSPNSLGEEGITYEYNNNLMTWSPNSGHVGDWLRIISDIEGDEATGFRFSYIPDGQVLFEYKYQYGGDWRQVKYSGGTLYCLETGGTVVSAVTVGQTFTFEAAQYGNSYRLYGKYENGWIGFKRSTYLSFQNVWDGSVNGGHYELIDKFNYPYLGSTSDVFTGIPKFNGRGQVVRNAGNVSTKNIHFNSNESSWSTSHRVDFYTTGTNNGPDYIFAPTQGGTEGQVLVSGGENAAPTWATMIKALKISSDDYEALTVKDPNTLYLIVDE